MSFLLEMEKAMQEESKRLYNNTCDICGDERY